MSNHTPTTPPPADSTSRPGPTPPDPERYFRALFENVTDIVTILDGDGTIVYESPSVERVLGYTVAERVGSSSFDYIHVDDLDSVRDAFAATVRDVDDIQEVRFRFRHGDGSWRVLETTGRNLLNDPEISGIVATTRDVTERVTLEEQLREAQKMEALGRLAGGVAHDFNNALTVIRGYAEALIEDDAYERRSEELDEILHAADRAAALTRQLLAFGKRDVAQPEIVDVGEVIGRMEEMLHRLIGETVELRTEPPTRPVRVSIGSGHLEQVLMNLVVNAREAMPGGGRITLASELLDPAGSGDGPRACLEVRDDGTGIPREVREHLFEPFFTTKEEGTGLGLAIVYGIVDGAGGEIEIESEPGAGTTVRILLPTVQRDPGSEEEAAPDEARDDAVDGTILLVEDESSVRSLTRSLLENAGHRVLEAADGESALEHVDETLDLVVTDVVLPSKTGFEVAEELRRHQPDLPVLFVSGYPEDDRVRDAVSSERAAFLQKPFDRDALLQTVRKSLTAS